MPLPLATFGNLISGDGILILLILGLFGAPVVIGIAIVLFVTRKNRSSWLRPPPLPPAKDA